MTVKIHIMVLLHPEDGSSLCLQNIGTHLPDYMVSLPRSPQYRPTLLTTYREKNHHLSLHLDVCKRNKY
jgi:hypothetical protein